VDFLFESTLDGDISGTLTRTNDGLPFSADPVAVTVPAHGRAGVTFPLKCAAGTSFGRFDGIGFDFASLDRVGDAGIEISIEVLAPRTISVATNLPQKLVLDITSNSPTLCQVIIQDSGGGSEISITPGVVPPSLAVDIGTPRVIAEGAGDPFPDI
jgi:hypothetical protein